MPPATVKSTGIRGRRHPGQPPPPPRAGRDKTTNGLTPFLPLPASPTQPTRPQSSSLPASLNTLPAGRSSHPHPPSPAMAHSGNLSAVDAILAEAADLVALEQIAKLNTAHLTDDSALPSSLESRFRKLKSLPTPAAPLPVKTLGRSVTAPHAATPLGLDPPNPTPPQQPPAPAVPQQQQQPEQDAPRKKENSPPPPPLPVAAVHDDDDEDLERLFGGGRGGRPMLRERNRGTQDDSSTSPPPRQACCFGFSSPSKKGGTPTAKSKKKVHGSAAGERGGDVLGINADQWGDENRRMVTELKDQQRKLKEALQEQVKVSRETARMAQWVKQASARMTHTAAIDDLLSDCDDDDELYK